MMLLPLVFAAALTVPVPGGLAALAHALGIDAPDRGRAVAEIVRVVYGNGRQRELLAYFATLQPGDRVDTVPLPLSPEIWSAAVFHRAVNASELFAAVLSDRPAALLAYGLSALDDETLTFFATHPALLTRLYQRDAAVFSAFAGDIRIRAGRIVPPGGTAFVPLWHALVREKVSDPERFVQALMSLRRGRVAYLYDVFANIDPPRTTLSVDRFLALADVASRLFVEWDVRRHPFSRPPHDLLAMFLRLQEPVSDPATLATQLLDGEPNRLARLDQFAFAQRTFGVAGAETGEAAYATRAFPRFPMLMLTLERIGVQPPEVYAALARQAERVTARGGERSRVDLIHLQGAIALVDRMRRVRTIDRAAAEALMAALATSPAAVWVDRDLRRALAVPPLQPLDEPLLQALAGTARRNPVRSVSWEDDEYLVDFVSSELARIRQFRREQGGPSLDAALDLHRLATAMASTAAPRVAALADTLLADALLTLVYAADWPIAGRTGRVMRNAARRHDLGLQEVTQAARARTAWALPDRDLSSTDGWKIKGSILGLDVGLAALALRRVSAEPLLVPPALSSIERATFIESLGLLNPLELDDSTQRELAETIARGEATVSELARGGGDVDAVIAAVELDGRRARALRWAIAEDPAAVTSYFSTSELLRLGGGEVDPSAWGMSARKLSGCLCRIAPTRNRAEALVGRPHLGLLATQVLDLHLRVAVVLNELQLPAALAKSVLAAAAQEFVERARPSDADDWLTLARTARALSRERVEDYLAGATVAGPLRPALSARSESKGARR